MYTNFAVAQMPLEEMSSHTISPLYFSCQNSLEPSALQVLEAVVGLVAGMPVS